MAHLREQLKLTEVKIEEEQKKLNRMNDLRGVLDALPLKEIRYVSPDESTLVGEQLIGARKLVQLMIAAECLQAESFVAATSMRRQDQNCLVQSCVDDTKRIQKAIDQLSQL